MLKGFHQFSILIFNSSALFFVRIFLKINYTKLFFQLEISLIFFLNLSLPQFSKLFSVLWNLFPKLFHLFDCNFFDGSLEKGSMNWTFNDILWIFLHTRESLILVHAKSDKKRGNIKGRSMFVHWIRVTADNEVFSFCSLNDVNDIGHADNSCTILKHSIVLDLEIFSFSQRLVNWISFQHEGHFHRHIEANNIVVLCKKIKNTSY